MKPLPRVDPWEDGWIATWPDGHWLFWRSVVAAVRYCEMWHQREESRAA